MKLETLFNSNHCKQHFLSFLLVVSSLSITIICFISGNMTQILAVSATLTNTTVVPSTCSTQAGLQITNFILSVIGALSSCVVSILLNNKTKENDKLTDKISEKDTEILSLKIGPYQNNNELPQTIINDSPRTAIDTTRSEPIYPINTDTGRSKYKIGDHFFVKIS